MSTDRAKVVRDYQDVLKLKSDAERGLVVFKIEVLNQEDTVVQRGTWDILVKGMETEENADAD